MRQGESKEGRWDESEQSDDTEGDERYAQRAECNSDKQNFCGCMCGCGCGCVHALERGGV